MKCPSSGTSLQIRVNDPCALRTRGLGLVVSGNVSGLAPGQRVAGLLGSVPAQLPGKPLPSAPRGGQALAAPKAEAGQSGKAEIGGVAAVPRCFCISGVSWVLIPGFAEVCCGFGKVLSPLGASGGRETSQNPSYLEFFCYEEILPCLETFSCCEMHSSLYDSESPFPLFPCPRFY